MRVQATALILALLGLLTACAPITPPPSPTPTPTPEAPAVALPQTVPLGEFGYEMDYPEGWTARTQGSATQLEAAPLACDLRNDLCVTHDYRDLDFMRGLGLPDNASNEDLLALNRRFFEWEELSEPVETEAFGVPALALRYFDDEVYGYIVTGLRADEAFLLSVASPSAEGLDDVLPTFEAMLASIRPSGE